MFLNISTFSINIQGSNYHIIFPHLIFTLKTKFDYICVQPFLLYEFIKNILHIRNRHVEKSNRASPRHGHQPHQPKRRRRKLFDESSPCQMPKNTTIPDVLKAFVVMKMYLHCRPVEEALPPMRKKATHPMSW